MGEECSGFWMLKWPRVKWFLGGDESFGLERERFVCRDVGKWR